MAGLRFRKNLYGLNSGPSQALLIEGSATLTIGDVVDLAAGVVNLVGAGADMFGVVEGFVTNDGLPIESAISGEDYDGTYTAGGVGVGTYVAAADNATDKKVKALVRPFAPGDIYAAEADAALGTTGASASSGEYFDLVAASDQIDESDVDASVQQFFSYGADALLGGNYLLVTPVETQLFTAA